MERKYIYKVAVVDDEQMAVKAICHIIEKHCPQFEVVGTAGNGREGLKVIQNTSPDLVLTDIDMPLMNGLELARQASTELPNVCFVIISGYQDFEYAQDAIRSGVLDYLTKPIVPSRMLTTMKNVEEKLRTLYYHRRNGIFRKLCMGETIPLEEMQRFFPYREFYAALLRENGLPRRYSPAKELELYETIDEPCTIYGRDNMEQLFLIPSEVLGRQPLAEYMTNAALRQTTEGSYTTLLYYSGAFPRAEISGRIRDLYYWLNTLSTVGFSQVVDLDKRSLLNRRPVLDTAELPGVLQEMEQYAKSRKYSQLQKYVEKAFVQWEREKRPQIWLEQAARKVLNVIQGQTGDGESLIESEYQFEDAFYYSTSMEMLRQNLYTLFFHFPEKEKGNLKVDSPDYFENVKTYLNTHLSQPLSLQEISDLFAISQAYMSKLFRKYTHQSYNQYLTGIRMERAKQLMEEDNALLIKDIAKLVGYHDQFYFSRVFHAYTGRSPTEYNK